MKVEVTSVFIFLVILSALQSAGQTGLFTSILSVVSIQTGEIGFFFAFQITAIVFFYAFELVMFQIFSAYYDEDTTLAFYFIFIVLFMLVSIYIYRALSERHDITKVYSIRLWLDIFKIKVTYT